MRILMLTNEYPNDVFNKADWTWTVTIICREWVKQGHEVIVINSPAEFPSQFYKLAYVFRGIVASFYDISENDIGKVDHLSEICIVDNGVKIYNCPIKKIFPGGKYKERVLSSQKKKILNILNKEHFVPDIITGHWVNPQLWLVAELGKHFKNAKSSFVFHGDYSKKKIRKYKVRSLINNVQNIGCRSQIAKKQIEEQLGIKNIFICPSGVPDRYFDDFKRSNEALSATNVRILSAGRLVRYKNFDRLIEACDLLKDKGFHISLEIAGEGTLEKKLKRKIHRSSLGNRVLIGKLNRDMLQKKMNSSDIFILVSKNETFGLVYLEAMLQGCIVIAANSGGINGIIIDGVNGFICESSSVESIVNVLEKVLLIEQQKKDEIINASIATAYEYRDSEIAKKYLENIH